MTTHPQAMSPGERVRAAVAGQAVDRVPFCFWHHFKPEGSGERLAAFTKDFFVDTFKLDIAKIMPDLPYPEPEQFLSPPRLSLDTPSFQQQLVCIRTLRSQLGTDYPIILTLFSPLTHMMRWMGKAEARAQLSANPAASQEALGTIASNLNTLMQGALEAGASGIFFSSMGATNLDFTRKEYAQIGRPSDLQALEGARDGWLNIVHVHADPAQTGDEIYFEDFVDYPVSVMSWSDRLTGPSLSEALTLTNKCLMGGLDERGPLSHGGELEIKNEILSAVSQVQGRHLILANGCSIPDDNPDQWLHLARKAVDQLK